MLTGTAIARAVIDLAEQLAIRGTASTVNIPALQADGTVSSSNLLLGPASQLVAETAVINLEEIHDDELVREIERRVTALKPHRGLPIHPDDAIGWDPDMDVTTTEPV